mmetsp:Transcript_12716/g.12359  ORF Transcript_12716/g.12359 Transcript_12716/m.12359 type:complete len:1152 (-) Transcript_12716:632-4087(-)|eukprot:CAMPEP_0119051588 /NCGR_PEP_ID=MMETSP1177-20130426/73155_1 /TAXON_ID=2985 /ORGANISM="Ochromonas sp, Strain CCMP1899" /LENGTH=1151 /DNA_ID=CAMNT_0007030843 /DNA_START=59 /DNA_END=3514 /DNA_ORIENTATION=-
MSSRRAKSSKKYEEDEGDSDNEGNDSPDKKDVKKRKPAKTEDDDNEDYDGKRQKGPSRSSASSRPDASDVSEDDYEGDEGEEDLSELETGQVMRVYVQDFMCHNKLTVEFGRHVNFVTGSNGSGKSAIVAALQLCLGATANSTGRGTKLDGLIREGCDGPAIMRVTLLNEGPDAYKPELYGNRIIIERKIAKGSGGGYKLMSKNSTTISTESKELDRICMTFNIQVKNPCCVLTQEESKKFIQGQEKEKYQFFLKATGLEMTKLELGKVGENIMLSLKAVEKSEKDLINKKAKSNGLKLEMDKLMNLDKYDPRIRECQVSKFWLGVYSEEDILKELQTQLDIEESILNKAQKELLVAEGDEALSGNKEELKKKMEAIDLEVEDVMLDIDQRNSIVKEKNLEVAAVSRDLKHITANRSENNARLNNVKIEISDLRARALENAADNERIILQKIDECDKFVEGGREDEHSFREQKNTVIQKVEELKKEAFQWDGQARSAEIEIRSAEEEYRRCSDTNQGRSSSFGPKVPDILRAIKNQRFKGEVIGPLGVHIKMKDGLNRWGEALEKSLFKILSTFIVTNTDDQRVLMKILNTLGCQQQHSVACQIQCPRHSVPSIEGALSVCDAIIVDNDLVFNCIIDQARADQTIMVADEEEVKQHFEYHNGKLQGFRNPRVKNAITAKGTRVDVRLGNQASQLNPDSFRRLLVADQKELLVGLTERINANKIAFKEAKEQQNLSYGALDILQSQIRRSDDELRAIGSKIRQQQKRKVDLEVEMAEIQAVGRIDTTNLEEEELELKDALDQLLAPEVEKKALMEEVLGEMKKLKADVNEAEKRKAALERDFKKESSKLEKLVENDESKKREVQRARKDVATKEKAVAYRERMKEDRKVLLQQALDIANEKTPELIEDWDGNPIEIDKKMNTIQKLDNEENRLIRMKERDKEEAGLGGRTKELVHSQLAKAKLDYKVGVTQYTAIKEELDNLQKDFKSRRKLWNRRLKDNEKVVRRHFDVYLQRKGFAGTVLFNHQEHILKIECQTDNHSEASRVNDVRCLSGGERSYTTLCLLLALGHVIEFPFRLMDEYDVFLDEVSRKVTLTELQRYALQPQQRGRQFLIITPNNLNDVITSNDVKIIKMAPPSRKSAHGLQQQTIATN